MWDDDKHTKAGQDVLAHWRSKGMQSGDFRKITVEVIRSEARRFGVVGLDEDGIMAIWDNIWRLDRMSVEGALYIAGSEQDRGRVVQMILKGEES